jgi:ABC-type enterochelin transport system substrate-binding protein
MKKIAIVIAAVMTFMLVSCGGNCKTETTATDSTKVDTLKVDTLKVDTTQKVEVSKPVEVKEVK